MAIDPTLLHQLSLLLQSKSRDAKRKGMERCREKGRGRGENERCIEKKGEGRLENEQSLTLGLGLEKASYLYVFFLSAGLVEPVRFGSVQSVSNFENRHRTKPEFFCDFLIGYFGFFSVFFFRFSRFNRFIGFFAHPYFQLNPAAASQFYTLWS